MRKALFFLKRYVMNRCDFCKRTDIPLYHALMPRHKNRWVRDAHGTIIVPVYDGMEFLDTTICQLCIDKLASLLPEVIVDE
jgi:hypothetical protein